MINTLLLNIKNTDWYKINEYTYTFTKEINLYNSNVSIQFYDTDGNNLNVGAKIDNVRGIVTFTYDKAENISAVFFVPTAIEEVKENVYKSNYPTSTYLNEDKGWIEQAYKNEQGVPVVADRIEHHTISPINSAVQLTEIPDKYYGIEFRLKDSTVNLKRLYNLDEIATSTNSYYIGKNNMIYCSTNLIGKLVEVSYKGMGKTIINCNMIYYRDAINSVPRILEDLIDAGYRAIDALATIGNAVLIIEQLKEDIKTGNALHQTLASDFITADEKHRIAVNDASLADAKHSRAVSDANIADSNHTRAEQDSNTANSNHNIAVSDNLKATQDHNTASSDHVIALADHTQTDKDHIQLTADLEASKQFLLEHPDINTAIGNKVDKVEGKGLSTNDYDNLEKAEVAKVKELEKYIESLQNDIIPPSMSTNKYRYVRCSATSNTQSGNYVSYSEIKVMDGNTNIAFGCNVIDVLGDIDTGMIKYVTDGKSQKDDPSSCLDLSTLGDTGGVTVDLGFPQSFQKIIVYHWVGESRKYNNVKVEVSLDKSKWVTLFNNSTDGGNYTETYEGKTVEVPQNDVNEVIKYNNYCTERLPDNKNNKLRVATFNMHGDNYLNFDAYKNYVTKNLLHFIGLQEVETTKGAIENKFNIYDLNKVVYGRSSTVNVYNAIHSNRSLETPVVTNLPGTGEGRILVKSSTILNGKKVSLYVTHLSYTEASDRPLQMAKIKEIMDTDTTPYKILMGDFNATANDFYNLLGNNYTSIQGYQGNWHETNLDDVYKSIDNIFITKNITINKVVLNPNMMGSDHRMLWAELTLN